MFDVKNENAFIIEKCLHLNVEWWSLLLDGIDWRRNVLIYINKNEKVIYALGSGLKKYINSVLYDTYSDGGFYSKCII